MNIKIHNSTYIVLLLSFLAGYFEYIYLFLLIIVIHEIGHMFFSLLLNIKISQIVIYPFGGITKYNEDLNIYTNYELFILLGGITFQLLFYFLCNYMYNISFITLHVFQIIKKANFILLSFNFLPILPLDGGRLINIIIDKLLPYKMSNTISLIISIIFVFIFSYLKHSYLSILLTLFLIKSIIIEMNNIKYKYNKFLLERYLNNYKFNKIKIIKNKDSFRRDYNHIINNVFESDYLHKLFDRKV